MQATLSQEKLYLLQEEYKHGLYIFVTDIRDCLFFYFKGLSMNIAQKGILYHRWR